MGKLRRINFWILFYVFYNCGALKDVKIHLPMAVKKGERAVFRCSYDLEGDALYQVKWYKGRREFYRFTPRENPSVKVFGIPGIDVMTHKSNGTHLILNNVDLGVAGHYSCEVSADAPSFHTALVTGDTDVVEIPRHTPTITGIKHKYRLGDILRGNCTSSESRPAANLTWFINDELASPMVVKHLRRHVLPNGLEMSHLGIRIAVNRHHFSKGRLKVRCTASIYNVYWQSTEKSVDEERPKLTVHNSVTPNTLGVNQLPPPYPPQPGQGFFDEDFGENAYIQNKEIIEDLPPSEFSNSAQQIYRKIYSSILIVLIYAIFN